MACHPAGTTENLTINRFLLMEKAKTFPLCCRSDWPSFRFSIQPRAGWDFLLGTDEIFSIVTGIEGITQKCSSAKAGSLCLILFEELDTRN